MKKSIEKHLMEGRTKEELISLGYQEKSIFNVVKRIENRKLPKRPTVPKQEASTYQYERLANAIILQGLRDLTMAYRDYKRPEDQYRIDTLEKFFREQSPRLTNVDPEVIIAEAKRRAEAIKEYEKLPPEKQRKMKTVILGYMRTVEPIKKEERYGNGD